MPWSVFSSSGAEKVLTSIAAGSVKLFDQILTADTASIDTGAILPGDYDVLEIWMIMRTDDTGAATNVKINLNNDSGSVYDIQSITGNNASPTDSTTGTGGTTWSIVGPHGGGGSANYAGIVKLTIPGYAGTTFYKTAEAVISIADATAGNEWVGTYQLGYRSQSAITRFAMIPATAGKVFKAGTRLLIFGRGGVPRTALTTTRSATAPSNPQEGDYWIYPADAANGVLWTFRYNAAGGTNKWEFVGGPPLISEVTAVENSTSASYTALTTAGPSVALPFAGDYDVMIGANQRSSLASADVRMSYDIGGTGAVDADSILDANVTSAAFLTQQRKRRKTGLSAVTLTAKYKTSGGTAIWENRIMEVTPVRVAG